VTVWTATVERRMRMEEMVRRGDVFVLESR